MKKSKSQLLGSQGMVDIGDKKISQRRALASASIILGEKAFHSLLAGQSPKGDVLATAKVSGIMAAKMTPQLIPMCHPLELNKVNIHFEIDHKAFMITAYAEVNYRGKTGVEMEALTAASAAALTIYDMMKWADKSMVITNVLLWEKQGGKSGPFKRT